MSLFRNIITDFDFISAQNDENQNLAIKNRHNRLHEGAFEAVILSGLDALNSDMKLPSGSPRYYWVRIRALDGSDDGRESPYTFPKKIRVSKLKFLINGHRCAFYDTEHNLGQDPPKGGEVWMCKYMKKNYFGPIVCQYKIRDEHSEKPYTMSDADADALASMAGSELMGDLDPPKSGPHNMADLSGLPFVNFEQMADGLTPILDYIASKLPHEHPDGLGYMGYNDFNCGRLQSGMKSCSDAVRNEYDPDRVSGADLYISQRTLRQIMDSQKRWKVGQNPGQGLVGVGKYLIVPSTLDEIVKHFNLPMGSLFSPNLQDGIATYIIMAKNPVLGGYLIAKHDDSKLAAHQLAKEWSSFPSQYTEDDDGNPHFEGQSYFAYLDPNEYVSDISTQESIKLIESWRQQFQSWLGKEEDPTNNRYLLE